MSFTDQKPRKATRADLKAKWLGEASGVAFRCYLCGYRFKLGDYWRWISATKIGLTNFVVCEKCDDIHVLDKWVVANKELEVRFWWAVL